MSFVTDLETAGKVSISVVNPNLHLPFCSYNLFQSELGLRVLTGDATNSNPIKWKTD